MIPKLTNNQQIVLDAIREHFEKHRYSPSLRELCEMTGKNSTSTIFHTVCALEQKGFVKTTPGQKRSIRLSGMTPNMSLVVTCKDCKFRQKANMGVAIWSVCHKLNRQTADDFYCAYGEVKDE